MFVNSANYSTYTLELVHEVSCDFNKYVFRVETTDPTDPTGVYRQEDNIVHMPENEGTVSLHDLFTSFLSFLEFLRFFKNSL